METAESVKQDIFFGWAFKGRGHANEMLYQEDSITYPENPQWVEMFKSAQTKIYIIVW